MVKAVVDDAPDADDGEADERTLLDRLLEALVAGGDELARMAPPPTSSTNSYCSTEWGGSR
jgi:hypothetical protein